MAHLIGLTTIQVLVVAPTGVAATDGLFSSQLRTRMGLDVHEVGTVSGAIGAIEDVARIGGTLDLVVCPVDSSQVSGLLVDLHEAVRQLPDSVVLRSSMYARSVPVLAVVDTDHGATGALPETLNRDCNVRALSLPASPEEVGIAVGGAVSRYRHGAIDDLLRLGLGIRSDGYRFRMYRVYQGPMGRSRTQSEYFARLDSYAEEGYGRLYLLSTNFHGTSLALEEFEALLNSGSANETSMQRFLETRPDFLMELGVDTYWSDMLVSGVDGKFRPDFLLRPFGFEDRPDRWPLIELKGPRDPLLGGSRRQHPVLSAKVNQSIQQVKNYQEWLLDPRNEQEVRSRYGHRPITDLTVIIGRRPDDPYRFHEAAKRLNTDVTVKTYDDLLQWRRELHRKESIIVGRYA